MILLLESENSPKHLSTQMFLNTEKPPGHFCSGDRVCDVSHDSKEKNCILGKVFSLPICSSNLPRDYLSPLLLATR